MQLIAIYVRKRKIFVTAQSRTAAGFWVQSDQVRSIPETADGEQVVSTILAAFDESRSGIGGPVDHKSFRKVFLRALEAKSMADLHSDAIGFGAERQAGKITFEPSKNLGPKEGFGNVPNAPRPVADSGDPAAIYAAFKQALEASK